MWASLICHSLAMLYNTPWPVSFVVFLLATVCLSWPWFITIVTIACHQWLFCYSTVHPLRAIIKYASAWLVIVFIHMFYQLLLSLLLKHDINQHCHPPLLYSCYFALDPSNDPQQVESFGILISSWKTISHSLPSWTVHNLLGISLVLLGPHGDPMAVTLVLQGPWIDLTIFFSGCAEIVGPGKTLERYGGASPQTDETGRVMIN